MLTINLNLPTLPTQDQKDAMDGANTPDSTNVFITANDLTPQVNSDWNAVSGVEEILNKPTIPDASLLVPYTGANADVNLGEFGIQLGNLEFDNTPTNVPTAAGSLYYNDTDGTLDLKLKGGNVTLQVGQEQVTRVVNKTATNITLLEANYQAVRITGAQGQRLKVDLALATTDVLSAETIGLVTETIANNQEGFITTSGLIRGINTTGSLQSETWADGDILYLSGVTAGNITNVKPTAPLHLIVIGYVVHSHITQGTIYVKVDNGYELNELHNVLLTSSADKDILAYESSTSLWKNKSASTLGLAPLASPTFTGTVTSPAIILSSETASTIASFDASKNIKSLPLATYPSLTELSYVKGVTSAIQTQIDSKSEKSILLFSSNLNPADSSDYYFSIGYIAGATSPNSKRFKFDTGSTTAIKLVLQMTNASAASSELVTLNLRNITTGTDYLIGTFDMSLVVANTNWLYEFAFSHTINTTDQWAIKMTTPAWATNPTATVMQFKLYYK